MESIERVGWRPGPIERGTLNIVWSALVTLGLCVWTAVHPNIQLRSTQKSDLAIRMWMMVVAVMFPEILISAAWQQRVSAYRLAITVSRPQRKYPNRIISQVDSTSNVDQDHFYDDEWSREQAFFVVMGGFAFKHTYRDEDGLAKSMHSILTVDGFELMRQAEYTPQLTKADVEERSNADVIAKLIVVSQVVWFAIQVVARLASNLTITALEIHTIVHVGCAIIMYILWWHKPYAVNRSVFLLDENERKIGDLFLFDSILREMHKEAVREHEKRRREYWENSALANNQILIEHDLPPENPRMPSIEQALHTYNSDDIDSQSVGRFETMLRSLAESAHAGLQCILDQNPEALSILEQPEWRGVRQTTDNFTLRSVWGSWTVDTGHEMSMAKLMHFLFNLLYGGGHLAAWNSTTFPTEIEATLWRVSGILVAGLFTYGSMWVLFWIAVRSRSKWLLPIRQGDANIFMGPFFSSVILAYFAARCYFFIESIISLRSLPSSAYVAVSTLR